MDADINKEEEKVKAWNSFCEEGSELYSDIEKLLESQAGPEEIEAEIKKIAGKKQSSLDSFAEKILSNGSPDETIWYLERGTELTHLFRDFIEREFPIRCPEIKPPWVKGLHILYDKLREAERAKRGVVWARPVTRWSADEENTRRTAAEIFEVLQRNYTALGKHIARDTWSHIVDKSWSLMMGEELLLWSRLTKSIEQEMGCQIFIKPIQRDVGVESQVLTDEECEVKGFQLWFVKRPRVNIRRHFIFYKPCPEDVEIERFRVAHELGHCALHWPLDPRKRDLEDKRSIPEVQGRDLYAVRFSEKEEVEADMFACFYLIEGQRAQIKRGKRLKLEGLVVRKIEEYAQKKLLHRF